MRISFTVCFSKLINAVFCPFLDTTHVKTAITFSTAPDRVCTFNVINADKANLSSSFAGIFQELVSTTIVSFSLISLIPFINNSILFKIIIFFLRVYYIFKLMIGNVLLHILLDFATCIRKLSLTNPCIFLYSCSTSMATSSAALVSWRCSFCIWTGPKSSSSTTFPSRSSTPPSTWSSARHLISI